MMNPSKKKIKKKKWKLNFSFEEKRKDIKYYEIIKNLEAVGKKEIQITFNTDGLILWKFKLSNTQQRKKIVCLAM